MNSGRDLMKRLLHLLPVQSIKDEFQLTGTGEDVIDAVTGGQTQITIKSFVLRKYSLAKQNIYLFELNSNFRRRSFNSANFPFQIENARTENGQFIFHCFPRTRYTVYLSDPVAMDELHFLHPVTIKITGSTLIIHFIKLVKNISHYYTENRLAKTASQENTEDEILRTVLNFFAEYSPTSLDINAGVKYLWHIDWVDCSKIQWRKAFSSATEVMDGSLTFKQRYPQDYQQIIISPLVKTVFKNITNDDYLCREFTADPENGQISTNQFSQDNQVNNVISEILRHT